MYLWDLLKQYELKFTIVYDRFDEATYGERTVESLKDRYYSVARIILEHRRIFDHPIIKSVIGHGDIDIKINKLIKLLSLYISFFISG